MSGWISLLIAFAVLALLAPLIAWVGRKHGRSVKGNLGLAAILLGIGEPLDPPSKHMIEAKSGEEQPPDATGEPKDAPDGS